jgi:hypothetical protein
MTRKQTSGWRALQWTAVRWLGGIGVLCLAAGIFFATQGGSAQSLIGGVLVGIGGSSLVAALQEALHYHGHPSADNDSLVAALQEALHYHGHPSADNDRAPQPPASSKEAPGPA